MSKQAQIFLRHILESIDWIQEYISGMDKKKFLEATQVQDAVVRRLQIIGEATKYLPRPVREQSASVPWKHIAGMRDILTHEYFGVDLTLVWNTAKKDLPKLKKAVIQLLQQK